MNISNLSVKNLCLLTEGGMVLSMLVIIVVLYGVTADQVIVAAGTALIGCAVVWLRILAVLFGKRLSLFTTDLCCMLDDMMDGSHGPQSVNDSETLFARIHYRVTRLYTMMQENRRKVDEERQELQALVSNISHQVKTPISNLKLVTDTLLTKPVTESERTVFLQAIGSQTDKLGFLLQALVKTSQLETGVIQLQKKNAVLYQTLAQAVSGIIYDAETKGIAVTVDCPEELYLPHDSKWTAEALFNLLDNGIKYTPAGGSVSVTVEPWELYVKIDIADTGKGIAECEQATIFRRFYREQEVHDTPGAGIGLYLAREIITRQGGYIKVNSQIGQGSTFSVFLPVR